MKKTQPIKERLNAHLDMLAKLDALKLELKYAEEQYGSCGSPNFSGVPGGGHREMTQTEAIVHRKIELENKVKKKQDEIDRDWAELEPLIEQLKPIETLIMNLRYLYGGEWEDVCFAIFGKFKDYAIETDRYMNKMFKAHGRALLSLAEMTENSDGTPTEV